MNELQYTANATSRQAHRISNHCTNSNLTRGVRPTQGLTWWSEDVIMPVHLSLSTHPASHIMRASRYSLPLRTTPRG